ncbi:MAG: 16S rRNA (cytidine(1402)-2'-O)-methyltransferase [Candidatus Falkowbacteria bacterium]|nr:16S rRNA (cytidine(1402)-2'-O)-methyltransferase [Candidatus Falkowbacteria bacterium]
MLYIVATPIGNLEDISLRAIRILGEVDFILCEDTRVTKNLLDRYDIKTPMMSYHQHSEDSRAKEILKLLENGKILALVTDAGTPGISDPGGKLVQRIIEAENESEEPDPRYKIESIPGASAVTAALSISGLPTDRFIFLGFPPHKKGRQTFIKTIIESEWPVVVYESKHRIVKFLEELKEISKQEPIQSGKLRYKEKIKPRKELTSIVVCRELTKMHETIYRGDLDNIIKKIEVDPNAQRGEFVVIIGK